MVADSSSNIAEIAFAFDVVIERLSNGIAKRVSKEKISSSFVRKG